MNMHEVSLTEEEQAIATHLADLIKSGKDRQAYTILRTLKSDQRSRIARSFLHKLQQMIHEQE